MHEKFSRKQLSRSNIHVTNFTAGVSKKLPIRPAVEISLIATNKLFAFRSRPDIVATRNHLPFVMRNCDQIIGGLAQLPNAQSFNK